MDSEVVHTIHSIGELKITPFNDCGIVKTEMDGPSNMNVSMLICFGVSTNLFKRRFTKC